MNISTAPLSDKVAEVISEDRGVTVISQYSVLGPYDFVNIVEAPDTGVITRLSVELGSRGTLQVMCMPAMPLDDFIATINN